MTNASSNTVQTYTINQITGDLTSVGTDATGTYPLGVAVDPTGRFAYVTNASSNTVQTYTINQSTGDLTSVGTDTTGLFPYSVTVDPTGRFAYVANNDSSTIQTYTINQSTGDLTSVGTDTTGLFPYSVTVDPTGRFAYVPNSGSNTVQTYTINNFSAGGGYFAGSLGIGTTSPTAKIHAVGNQNGATRLRMDNTDSGTSAQVGLELNNNSGQALLGLYSSNYSAAPVLQNKLYFANTIGGMMFRATAGSDIRFGVGASVNDVDDLTIDSNGNIGIGTTAPARALHVKIGTDSPPVRFEDTNGYCEINPTTTTWTCTSDARLKKDVIGINTTNTLNKLMNLRPVSFKWNTQTNNDKRYGFIAQEVESIFPDLVTTDEKGIKTVAYGSLTPFIISGMQEQNVQLSALTNSLTNLATLSTPLTLDEFGQLSITGNSTGSYQVTNVITATPINNRLAAFTQTITAIIEAGLTRTKELVVSGRAQIADLSVGNLSINGQGLREYVESIVEENQPTIPVIVEIIPTPSQTPSDLAVNTISTESITTSSLNSTNLQVTDQTRLGSLIVQSDATVAGTLNADQVETATLSATSARIAALEAGIAQMETVRATTAIFSQATISGTLYAETIANLDQQIATAMQQPSLLDVLFNQTPDNNEDLTILKRLVDTAVTTASAAAQLDQSIADLNLSDDDVVITGQAAFINQYLKVNGTAYVADSLGVGNLLKVGNRLELTDSYLAFHADPSHENDLNIFSIQPSGKGILSLMAGLMTLDETGTVTIVGDLKVAGDVEVRGTLLSNLIESSDPNQPVRIKVAGATTDITNEQSPTTNPDGTPISHPSQPLGGSTLNNPNSTNLGSRFEIIGNLGQAVATVSGQGKISLTGGINIDSDSIARPDVQGTATNSAQLTQNSTKTTGRATLPAGNSELIIRNPNITADSLVYLTPLGSTNNQVLYVKQTTAAILSPSTPVNPYPTPTQSAYFVVGLDSPAQSDIAFTWWIVN